MFYQGVAPQDVAEMLQNMGMVEDWDRGIQEEDGPGIAIVVDWNMVDKHMEKVNKSKRIPIEPECLRWTPLVSNLVNPFRASVCNLRLMYCIVISKLC